MMSTDWRITNWIIKTVKAKHTIIFLAILIIGISVRSYQFDKIPGGFNQDEAMVGYEAWSILNYGFDQLGYVNPVYFVGWGSGNSALYPYLAIPFISWLGPTTLAVRLPMLLVSISTLVIFYLLVTELNGKYIGLAALALLAISPWHIMLSRWALDCNLLPFFILLTAYFIIKGITKNWFFILASISGGLSLYCYALSWIFLPLFLGLLSCVLLWLKVIRVNRFTIIAFVILLLLAAPLITFVLVNQGVLPEVKTTIFSIPRLTIPRTDEFSLSKIPLNFSSFISDLLINQNDGVTFNQIEGFGILYKFGMPFMVIGFLTSMIKTVGKLKNREYYHDLLLCIWMVSSFLVPMLTNVNIYKSNATWLPCLYFCVIGFYTIYKIDTKNIITYTIVAYTFSFIAFGNTYFSIYPQNISKEFNSSSDKAIHFAANYSDREIVITKVIRYSLVIFYLEIPPKQFMETVQYRMKETKWLTPIRFDRFSYEYPDSILEFEKTHIIVNSEIKKYRKAGYQIESFDNYSVAYYP